MVSCIVMLILPVWYERVAFFPVIVISIVSVILINEFGISKKLDKFVSVVAILMFIYYGVCFYSTYKIDKYRVDMINKQRNQDVSQIKVLRQPFRFLWNNNFPSAYFADKYKAYLSMGDDTELIIYDPSWRDYLNIILGK